MNDKRGGGVGRALSLGFDLAVGVGLFTFGGYWLDQRRGGGQRWTLIGLGAGVLYAAYEFWKALRDLQDQDRREEGRKRAGDARGEGGEPPE
jgi:hypothetical protein